MAAPPGIPPIPEKPIAKIVDVRDAPSPDPLRVGKLDRIVTYSIDAYRMYVTRLPAEDFTEEKLKARIKVEMAERVAFIGREIKLE